MPKFMLRSWAEQTLYDCRDYEVEAETLDEAKELLGELQDEADSADCACASDPRVTAVYGWHDDRVVPLDPDEIVDGESGIVEITEMGNPVRDDPPFTVMLLAPDYLVPHNQEPFMVHVRGKDHAAAFEAALEQATVAYHLEGEELLPSDWRLLLVCAGHVENLADAGVPAPVDAVGFGSV